MKKSLGTFFIAIMLLGVAAPISSLKAADPMGNCTTISGRSRTVTTTTKANCPSPSEWNEITEENPTGTPDTGSNGSIIGDLVNIPAQWIAGAVGAVAVMVLQITSLFVYLSGLILNFVIQYTVVDMTKNLAGTGSVIDTAWTFIRDLGNMLFIFVLLYASIRTIIGKEKGTQALIVKMVVVGILVNFSLFFTKIVIDLSNVLAMTFYDAIAPNALNANASFGLSNSFMELLDITTLWKTSGFSGTGLLTIGVLGTIFTLITAFVFLAVSIMFVVRFVVLIFVLILSPVAFFSYVLPNTSGLGKQWLEALTGQAFFAPIYFIMTWIVVLFGRSMNISGTNSIADVALGVAQSGANDGATADSIGVFVNFIILIALLIASLVTAKKFSGQGGVGVITNWATEKAGGALFGGMAFAGRKSFGQLGNMAANNAKLQESAAASRTGRWLTSTDKWKGLAARGALDVAKTARSARFDVRNASIPTSTLGKMVEGTLGRTTFGKAIGADEASRIPNIEVAATAQSYAKTNFGKPGTEGYKEEQSAKGKRIREADKAAKDELKSVQDKAKLQAGEEAAKTPAGTRTPADIKAIQEMVDVVKKMSKDQIKTQKAGILAIQEVAEAVNQKNMEAVEESGNYTAEEIQKIKDARSTKINGAFTSGPTVHIPAVGTAPARTGHEEAVRLMKAMDIATLAKMPVGYKAGDPATHTKPNLNNPDILEIYSKGLLGKLVRQNDFTQEKLDAVRKAIEDAEAAGTAGPNARESFAWFTTGPGKDIFI